MKDELRKLAHLAAWLGAGFFVWCSLTACGPLSAGFASFSQAWSKDPPPHTPGIPFYADPAVWAWALGVGVPAAHATVGIPGVKAIPGTPPQRRRAKKKAAVASAMVSPPAQ